MQKLWANYKRHNVRGGDDYLYDEVLQTGKYAMTTDQTFFHLKKVLGDCSVLMLKETYLLSGFGIVMPKGSLLKKYVDHE